MREVLAQLPNLAYARGAVAENLQADVPQRYAHLFRGGHSVSGFDPVGGNSARLLRDSDAAIDAMVADIDAATDHVHPLFYIWLPDNNGCKVAEALKRAVSRGVDTTIVFPARNDSWIVGAASRSYYGELLDAGVRIYEYVGGLLHTKSLTLDGEVALIGSANMDRRSFDLNYENNILFYDPALTAEMRQRQNSYIAAANPIDADTVKGWTWRRRLWNNTIAMLGRSMAIRWR